jgi:RNA polymerase sigma-70 factor, ECF subfamily
MSSRLGVDEAEVRGEASSDRAVVERARAGERAAMTELHGRYAKMIHAIVLARVPARDADDLAQDVFVRAMVELGSLRDADAFGRWVATIARNAAADHRRRKKPVVDLDEEHGATPARAVDSVRAREVLGAIGRLPEAYREVLLMRLCEGMTGPEIAARAGLTPGSVRVNLHRGMALLREELAQTREGDE